MDIIIISVGILIIILSIAIVLYTLLLCVWTDPGLYLTVDLISESECTEIRSVTESESRHILFTLTEL